MSNYYIELKEDWEDGNYAAGPTSTWSWVVTTDDCEIAKGKVPYGGATGEKQAHKDAERAATLDAKRESAKKVSYTFTPEI